MTTTKNETTTNATQIKKQKMKMLSLYISLVISSCAVAATAITFVIWLIGRLFAMFAMA